MYLGIIASHFLATLLLLLRCSLTEQHPLGLSLENLDSEAVTLLGTTVLGRSHPRGSKDFLEDLGSRIHRIKRFTKGNDADSAGAAVLNPNGRDPSRAPVEVTRPDDIAPPRTNEINWSAVKEFMRWKKQKQSQSSPSNRGQTDPEGGSSTTNCGRFQQRCLPTSPQHRPIPPVVRIPFNPGQGSRTRPSIPSIPSSQVSPRDTIVNQGQGPSTHHIHVEPRPRPSVPSIPSNQVASQGASVIFPSFPFRQSNRPRPTSSFPSTSSQIFPQYPQWSAPHFHIHPRPSGVGRSGS